MGCVISRYKSDHLSDVNIILEGLVNYVSSPGSTAMDRSLSLAESIARNGQYGHFLLLTKLEVLHSSSCASSRKASNI